MPRLMSGQAFPPSKTTNTALGVTPGYLVREQNRGRELVRRKPWLPYGRWLPCWWSRLKAADVIGKYESDNVGSYNAVNQYGGHGGW